MGEARRPEELINGFLRLKMAAGNIATGLGTLALLWSTVVLLGGFVSVLRIKEFWFLTTLSFIMAFRVGDIFDNEFARGIYTEEPKIIALIWRQKWARHRKPVLGLLGVVWLPKYVFLLCFYVLASDVTPTVTAGASVWRLLRRDYGDAGGDAANSAKLSAALDIFYVLVLFQSLAYLYRVYAGTMSRLSNLDVRAVTMKQCGDEEWASQVVSMYYRETRKKLKDGELPDGWDLITYAVELVQSSAPASLWGARLLDKFFDTSSAHHQNDTSSVVRVRQELLYSGASIQNLIDMIGRRDTRADDDMEKRERAAAIVAHLASDLLITQHFPQGSLQPICALLETCCEGSHNGHGHGPSSSSRRRTNTARRITALAVMKRILCIQVLEERRRFAYESRGPKELVSKGLLILEGLTRDEGNCAEIIKDQRLLSKITSPLKTQGFLSYARDDTMTATLSKLSLTVVSRLLVASSSPGGDAGATIRLRQELATGSTEAVTNLMGVLEADDSQAAHQMHEQALEILTELALGDYLGQQDFVKLFNALHNIVIAPEPSNALAQQPNNAAVAQETNNADRERATRRLRGKAGEALARLLPLCTARAMLPKENAINLLTKVLDQISSTSRMGTTTDAATGEAADSDQPATQENEMKSDERKSTAAMLSLSMVIIRNENVISKEGFAGAISEDAAVLVRKLKEILEANKHINTAECLRIVKLTCQEVIAIIQANPSCIQHFSEHNFKESLTEASDTMSEVDVCMLFAGNDRDVVKPARSLASLVKEAQELMDTAQEQGS